MRVNSLPSSVSHALAIPLLLLALMTSPLSAQSGRGDVAAPRADRNSQAAHAQLLDKARRGGIDLYFAGDSITRRWGTSDPQYRDLFDNWTSNFFGWNAGNFGWGGDTVQNILWRLENGELDAVQPKAIVLMAGTNNLGGAPRQGVDAAAVEDVTSGIQAILRTMQAKAPDAVILLTGVTPRRDASGGTTIIPTIAAINQRLAALADGTRVRFLDINGRLMTADGALIEGVTVDGLHLSVAGYQVWADALKPMLTAILGAPAAVDHAPPPTGDPGIR